MHNKAVKIGTLVFAFLISIFVGAFLLIIFSKHVPLSSSVSDELGWLSLLGAIVGLVGAIGGIVVGVISLVTLSQIDSQVKNSFEQRYKEHQEDLNNQSAQWATGIKLWTQATMTSNPISSAELMERALHAWPSAPGARIEALYKFLRETEEAYILDLRPGSRDHLKLMSSTNPTPYPRSIPQTYLKECVRWWTLANEYERENYALQLDFIASKIYAMYQDFPQMIKYLQQLLSHPNFTDLTIEEQDVMIWLSSCSRLDQLSQLQSLLVSAVRASITISAQKIMDTFTESTFATKFYLAITVDVMQKQLIIGVSHGASSWNLTYANSTVSKEFESDALFIKYVNENLKILFEIPQPNLF